MTRILMPLLALTPLLLAVTCENKPSILVAGDGYLGAMAPYLEHHSRCPFIDLTQDERTLAQIFTQDAKGINAWLSLMPVDRVPVVVLSNGLFDEATWGPESTALILTSLVRIIHEARPDAQVLSLDYELVPLGFWDYVDFDANPNWFRVRMDDVVDNHLGPDGVFPPLTNSIERVMTLGRQFPHLVTCNQELAVPQE